MFDHLSWSLLKFETNASLRSSHFGTPESRLPQHCTTVKYPVRALRYWFMYNLIDREHKRLERPLNICEVGVDVGQMLMFMDAGAANGTRHLPEQAATWDAIDKNIRESVLSGIGYSRLVQLDLEDPNFTLPMQYDVMILLHVLEHLHQPEQIFAKLSQYVVPNGLIIGGFPVVPDSFISTQEWWFKNRKRDWISHHSAFSPQRVRKIAEENQLQVEMLTGAFLMRKHKFFLENQRWWMKFNLLWGALFPSAGGEVYWSLRKI
ncbi:MAG: class I SAM-dependent methyltransferase [Acidobacteriota bacterium]|nr:class I SAM-dependent methyltransferase [Acidobacteriota bacterium]